MTGGEPAGFGWERDNCLHRSLDGAVFWIWAENRTDNAEMFSLSLSSAYVTEQFFPWKEGVLFVFN